VNPDGTFDSICLKCLRMVAEAMEYDGLADAQKMHFCEEDASRQAEID
jgi:hypothetical protein